MTGGSEQPLVSVVMIFWNAPQTSWTKRSAACSAQTYGSIELLLCDDGSDDASTALARHWASVEPARVRYLEHEGSRSPRDERNTQPRHSGG